MEPIIRVAGVKKAFGPKVVYEDATLDIFPGETLTIIGGSGTGKSVLLKMLIGLLRADAGSIQAFGTEVTKLTETQFIPIRRRIAMLFQGAALFDSLTVAQNIKYPLREHGWKDEKEMDARVAEVLELVGMSNTEKLKPAALSGGMRKRVGLARAIAVRPEVILWDEPTTGLDPINIRRINGLILSMQEKLGVTSVVVTHDMDTCFTVSDRIAMLYERRIAFVGNIEETRNSGRKYVEEFIVGGRGTLDPAEDEVTKV
ncbi:MAG TPA: ATP-binding cassette domain-containing protein [Myxococcota bacterium]|nr:ATP-binding cassette domain-containing protein [Myxococcota bacterium]HNH49454.1 ATP-binding cassette domain-containing protein [Myxococcota bacterium]